MSNRNWRRHRCSELSRLESCLCAAIPAMLWERSTISGYLSKMIKISFGRRLTTLLPSRRGGLLVRWGVDLP